MEPNVETVILNGNETNNQISSEVVDLKEDLSNFSSEHMHHRNPSFESAESTFELIMNKANKKENLDLFFNSSLIVAKPEFSQNDFYQMNLAPENDSTFFITDEENCGEYEGRQYYGYDCLVAFASKSTGHGYICPSMIIETDKNGKKVILVRGFSGYFGQDVSNLRFMPLFTMLKRMLLELLREVS